MPNTQNLATVGVTNRQDTDNIIVEQGGNIRRVQYEDIKTGILRGDAADGTISTFEESAEEFPIPAPATPQKTLWGRVKKFCSDFNDWKTGVMLFGHLVNNAESDSDTLPLAASVAKLLQEQITTNTGAIAQLNSDLGEKFDVSRIYKVRIDTSNASINTDISASYPDGFNRNNCFCVGARGFNSSYFASYGYFNKENISVTTATNIIVRTSDGNIVGSNNYIEVLLLKI